MQISVYISSGKKNAMYTLRSMRSGNGFHADSYIMNLARDPKKAETKARDWFARVWGDNSEVRFAGYADFDLNEVGGPEPWEREQIDAIEKGFMPFGKHAGIALTKMSYAYVLWWADQEISEHTKRPAAALIERMKGIAFERDLFKKREAKTAQREAEKANRINAHIGEVGDRREFTGTVRFTTSGDGHYGTWFLTVIDTNEGAVTYWNLLEDKTLRSEARDAFARQGDNVTFAARVKDHNSLNDEKQTIVSRATKVTIQKGVK